ncbi:MAG: hypothetical protein A2Y41_05660 [Spirochaetes bacterium GWB1_36_13]|nr:MAG: hypothetical protein A2Y41_05660 [Spirochaetes bacterium GWB1_36_13]
MTKIQREGNFGSNFERYLVSFLSFISGLILVYLVVKGPLFLNHLQYKTSLSGIFQIKGQDFTNLFLLTPFLIFGSVSLFLRKEISKYVIILTPLYLIYFVLSYTIGLEWSSSVYTGNSETYSFYFLFIMISALITLLYGLNIFPRDFQNTLKKKRLIIYSLVFVFFILVFSSMWIKEILSVVQTGTTPGYQDAPAAFWTIRFFDLGFTVPVGLISVYLLWTRPNQTYCIQFLFYGFFVTMITAVNIMGIMMYLNHDPLFTMGGMLVFMILAVIVFSGFIFVVKNFKKSI